MASFCFGKPAWYLGLNTALLMQKCLESAEEYIYFLSCGFFTLQHEQCTSTLSWIWMYRLIKYSVQSLKQKIKCTGMLISFEEQAFVRILLHKGQKQESFLLVWCVIFLWHIVLCLAIMHIVFSLFYIDMRSIPFFFKWPLFPVFFLFCLF